MSYIYMGSFDDRVNLYNWPNEKPTLKIFISKIIQNILIGRKSVVNDGYILNNPIIRDELFLKKESLLRELFFTGEVIVPERTETFRKLINEQIERGINTFKEIPETVKDNLDIIDKRLESAHARIPGPNSMTVWDGYYELMKSLETRSVASIGFINGKVDDFEFYHALNKYIGLPRVNNKPPSRTEWEKILEEMTKKPIPGRRDAMSKASKTILMNLGNEAYHYNFARCFKEETNLDIGVETSLTPAFSSMIKREKCDIDFPSGDKYLLRIPKFNKLHDINIVNLLLGRNVNDLTLHRARSEFISALENVKSNVLNNQLLEEMEYKAKLYNSIMNEILFDHVRSQNFSDAINYGMSLISNTIGLQADFGWFLSATSTRILTNLFANNPIEIDYTKNIMINSRISVSD